MVRLGLDVCPSQGLGSPELRMQLDETGGIVQLRQESPRARHLPFGRGALAAHYAHAREACEDGNYPVVASTASQSARACCRLCANASEVKPCVAVNATLKASRRAVPLRGADGFRDSAASTLLAVVAIYLGLSICLAAERLLGRILLIPGRPPRLLAVRKVQRQFPGQLARPGAIARLDSFRHAPMPPRALSHPNPIVEHDSYTRRF